MKARLVESDHTDKWLVEFVPQEIGKLFYLGSQILFLSLVPLTLTLLFFKLFPSGRGVCREGMPLYDWLAQYFRADLAHRGNGCGFIDSFNLLVFSSE